MKPLVSILIPAYNAGPWVSEAIQSALNQTWENKEVIVADDGSTDDTLAVARSYEKLGVTVVSHSNRGASSTRNRALDLARGEFIQWLDADDVLAPDKIHLQLRESTNSGRVLLSSSWSRFYFRQSKSRFKPGALWRDLKPVEWLQIKMEENAWMAIESWLVPRKLADAAGPWNTSLSADDDGEYFARVVAAASGIRFVPEARCYCRSANSRSLSRGFHSAKWIESQFQSNALQINCLRRLDDGPRTRTACLKLLQRWLFYFYPEHPSLVSAAERLARDLGGQLATPVLRWKYRPLKALFGWKVAKGAQFAFPAMKTRLCSSLDRVASAIHL